MANRIYSLEEKYAAVVAYFMTGTYRSAAKEVGIPYETVKGWAKTDWWEEMMQQAVRDTSAELRAIGLQIVRKATSAVIDRLDNGDEVSDKKGNIVRRKVPLRDALLASLTWFDKNRIINDMSEKHSNQKVDAKDLIKQMVEIGKAVKNKNLEALQDLPIPTDDDEDTNNESISHSAD